MSKATRFLLLTCLITFLAGCASVPLAPPSEDAEAKKFNTVSGKSSVYIYRNENYGGTVGIQVSVNDKHVGQTAPFVYYLLHLEPGIHKITCSAENTKNAFLEAESGQVYFVRQEVKLGVWSARCDVYETPVEDGKEGVLSSKLAQSNWQQ